MEGIDGTVLFHREIGQPQHRSPGALYKLDCKQKANLLEGPLTEMYGSAVSGPAVAVVPCLEGNRKIQGFFFHK